MGVSPLDNGGDVWEMYAVIDAVKEKSEQIYSLLRALYDIEENKETYFSKASPTGLDTKGKVN